MILFFLGTFLFLAQPTYSEEREVRMYLFLSFGCEECETVKGKIIPNLKAKYGHSIRVKEFNIEDPDNYRLMLELEETYGHRLKNPPPTIFVGDHVLDGGGEIRSRLDGIVREYYLKGGCGWPQAKKGEEDPGIRRFRELGILAILGGGLLDGVNPCAFTVLAFFVSYLSLIGRKGKEILLVGGAFTLSIFLSYLLVGIGVFGFIRRIPQLLGQALLILVTGGTMLLGAKNLYEYYRIRGGTFQMSCPVSLGRVRDLIKRYAQVRYYVVGAFIIGLIVSVIEFLCTGQIYLPIIFVLRHVPELQIHAFLYLVLYNLLFVLPLVVVFLLAYYGTTSEWLTRMSERHLGKTKLLTATLFFGIAGILTAFILR